MSSAIDTTKPPHLLARLISSSGFLGVPLQVHFGRPQYHDYVEIKNESERTLRITIEEVHLIPDGAEYDSWR